MFSDVIGHVELGEDATELHYADFPLQRFSSARSSTVPMNLVLMTPGCWTAMELPFFSYTCFPPNSVRIFAL